MPNKRSRRILPSAKYLHQCFDYDPDTGVLRWKKRRPMWHFPDARAWKSWNTQNAGMVAGIISKNGYRLITLDIQRYLSHRAIWKMMNREEPPNQIDHIDGDKSNNRWVNLRAATQTQQKWNEGMRKNNTSGYRGIYPRRAKWLAKIHVNGVSRYCGTFATPQEAAAAYEAMAREVHGEFYRAPRLRT